MIRPLLSQVTEEHIREGIPKFRKMFDEWEAAGNA